MRFVFVVGGGGNGGVYVMRQLYALGRSVGYFSTALFALSRVFDRLQCISESGGGETHRVLRSICRPVGCVDGLGDVLCNGTEMSAQSCK